MSDAPDYSWITEVRTVDAVDRTAVNAMVENPDWLLLGTGMGTHGQLCLTFAWPYPAPGVDMHGPTPPPTEPDRRPHSRACGPMPHPHGRRCNDNCPTCGGRDE